MCWYRWMCSKFLPFNYVPELSRFFWMLLPGGFQNGWFKMWRLWWVYWKSLSWRSTLFKYPRIILMRFRWSLFKLFRICFLWWRKMYLPSGIHWRRHDLSTSSKSSKYLSAIGCIEYIFIKIFDIRFLSQISPRSWFHGKRFDWKES